jgi:hypothetical protein
MKLLKKKLKWNDNLISHLILVQHTANLSSRLHICIEDAHKEFMPLTGDDGQ